MAFAILSLMRCSMRKLRAQTHSLSRKFGLCRMLLVLVLVIPSLLLTIHNCYSFHSFLLTEVQCRYITPFIFGMLVVLSLARRSFVHIRKGREKVAQVRRI